MKTSIESMMTFPLSAPKIEIEPLDETPFEVECKELRIWFIVPEAGQRRRYAFYEYPERKLTEVSDLEVVGRGKVHEIPCHEIRYRSYKSDGSLEREAYAYGGIKDHMAHWYGWWNLDDNEKLFTFKDEDVAVDWAPISTRITDAGRFHWNTPFDFSLQEGRPVAEGWESSGAGLWLLKIGEIEHRCLRFLDISKSLDHGIIVEGFVNAAGKTLLGRRYNGPTLKWDGVESQIFLKDAPTLIADGVPQYHWFDMIAEDALAGLPTSTSTSTDSRLTRFGRM